MACEEISRRHRPLAFRLKLGDLENAGARGHGKTISRGVDDRAGGFRRSLCRPLRLAHDEPPGAEKREGMWPGMQPPNQVMKAFGGPSPVDETFVLPELVRVCRLAVVLRCFLHAAGGEVVEGDDEQRRAQSRQVALDLVARLPGGDRPMRPAAANLNQGTSNERRKY